MAVIEFELQTKGKNEVADFFKDFYLGGMKAATGANYDVTFSKNIPFSTKPNNGVMKSAGFDVQMAFGDVVEYAVINSTAITESGKPTSHYDMSLKTGQNITNGSFPYGGVFRVNSVTITVTSV